MQQLPSGDGSCADVRQLLVLLQNGGLIINIVLRRPDIAAGLGKVLQGSATRS